MDKQRCRYILRACRANGADADDPLFREALEFANKHPELSRWLERERLIDESIAAKIREVAAPDELRQTILHGVDVSQTPHRWRTISAFVAGGLAAAIAVVFTIQRFLPEDTPPPSRFDAVMASVYDDSQQPISASYYGTSINDLRNWLAREGAPTPGNIPPALAGLSTIGCKAAEWRDVPSSVVCFRAPALYHDEKGRPVDRVIQLYTIDRDRCLGGSAGRDPIIFSRDEQSVATWKDGEHYYVLIVKAPEQVLRDFLKEELPQLGDEYKTVSMPAVQSIQTDN